MNGELSEDEVFKVIESMRIRDELGFKSASEYRDACELLSKDELIDVLVILWEKRQEEKRH